MLHQHTGTTKPPFALKSLALLTNSAASMDEGGGTSRSTSNQIVAATPSDTETSLSATSSLGGGLFKNFNLYWAATTLLALWFLFVHTPPILIRRKVFTQDPLFVAHIVGAGGIYLACIHNALLTPSTFDGRGQRFHIWVGKVGMWLGVLGALSGAILTWTRIDRLGLSFGIPITIGGIFQLFAQWRGYHCIQLYRQAKDEELKLSYTSPKNGVEDETMELEKKKKTYLCYHIGYMVGVFVAACGIPAVMRLLYRCDDAWPYICAIVALNILSTAYARWFIKRIPGPTQKNPEQSGVVSETSPLI